MIPAQFRIFYGLNPMAGVIEGFRWALAGSYGCLVMTEWPEFSRLDKEFDLMAHGIIIEGRRILTCKGADGICW